MRRNLVIAALVLGIVAMAAWLWVERQPAGPTDIQAPPAADQTADADTGKATLGMGAATDAPGETTPPAIAVAEGTTNSDQAMAETPEAQQEAYVASRVAELLDLGMEDDTASLDTILSELNNRDPAIREAAVEAAVQFGSRDAIPRLTDAAAQTDDPKEKSAILEAIEFLKLPTLTEALGQQTQTAPDPSSDTSSGP